MENKYYTPSIEEFHVGFEYEIEEPDGSYTKQELTVRDSLEFIDDHSSEFRVKYLDIDDIESLGFNTRLEPNLSLGGYDKDASFLFKKTISSLFPQSVGLNELYLIYKGPACRSLIYLTRSRFVGVDEGKILPEVHLFNGYIKNKTELQRILIQLGVC